MQPLSTGKFEQYLSLDKAETLVIWFMLNLFGGASIKRNHIYMVLSYLQGKKATGTPIDTLSIFCRMLLSKLIMTLYAYSSDILVFRYIIQNF